MPCLYFEDLLDEDYERFSDLETVAYHRTFQSPGTGFDREPLDVKAAPVTTIRQSDLNRFVNCPRDHLFSRLVDGPDLDYFAVGNCFHDFAKVSATAPEAVDEDAIEEVVNLIVAMTQPFDRWVEEPVNRTRYRVGLETIVAFLEANRPVGADFVTAAPGADVDRNVVAEYLGIDPDRPYTEWWFEDDGLGVKGTVDLVHSATQFVDYKSGYKDSVRNVVRKAPSTRPTMSRISRPCSIRPSTARRPPTTVSNSRFSTSSRRSTT